jgi:hypothetical protein
MSSLPRLIGLLVGGGLKRPLASRPGLKRAPACEALEGRQLLNGTLAGGTWPAAKGGMAVHFDHIKAGAAATGAAGNKVFTPSTLSAQAKTDLKTLQTDTQTLQTEIKAQVPSSMTDALKADQGTIMQALGVHKPTGGANPGGPMMVSTNGSAPVSMPGPGGFGRGVFLFANAGGKTGAAPDAFFLGAGSNLSTTDITSRLEAAGVPAASAEKLTSDLQAYQAAAKAVDPTLQAKIATDQAAVAKDLPAPAFPDQTTWTSTSTTT